MPNNIPSAKVPEAMYELLSDYAHAHKMNMSDAIRHLLTEAPSLQRFAQKQGIHVDFTVAKHGGGNKRSLQE